MGKPKEIRDAVHVFARVDERLANLIESVPVQRLRNIHQLGLSYLVYPGATHSRFEHSLGVMELAGRVFDVITAPENTTERIKDQLPELRKQNDLQSYWRRVVQAAALCHDIGHMPFSHAAEKELFPEDWNHERLSRELISSDTMRPFWVDERPLLDADDVVKLAVGKKEAQDLQFTPWQEVLSEVIVGDAFGVDRMDYLLRDSHHMGVPYGRFDQYRLIDTLRILEVSPEEERYDPTLGVEQGGLQSAEALLLARYFMYSQGYFHRVRVALDLHLIDFMKEWYEDGSYPVDIPLHLAATDNGVLTALRESATDPTRQGHVSARRILERRQFRALWERNPADRGVNPEAGRLIYDAAKEEFGEEQVKYRDGDDSGGNVRFPVLARDGRIGSSLSVSDALAHLPAVRFEYVFVSIEIRDQAKTWLDGNKEDILSKGPEDDEAL